MENPAIMTITDSHHNKLDELFHYYRKMLFDVELSDCMITLGTDHEESNFFKPKAWLDKSDKLSLISNIILNPVIIGRKSINWHIAIVLGMVHLKQYLYGNPGRRGYHNLEYAKMTEKVGIIMSDIGMSVGKKTGEKLLSYIPANSPFEKAYRNHPDKYIRYVSFYLGEAKSSSNKSQKKYTCPCGINMWGKRRIRVTCDECNKKFVEEKDEHDIQMIRNEKRNFGSKNQNHKEGKTMIV